MLWTTAGGILGEAFFPIATIRCSHFITERVSPLDFDEDARNRGRGPENIREEGVAFMYPHTIGCLA